MKIKCNRLFRICLPEAILFVVVQQSFSQWVMAEKRPKICISFYKRNLIINSINLKMTNLNVKYLGLDLKNPIIAGSSGLTNSIENLKAIEEAGAGAVVLKSIFEEEIYLEFAHEFSKLGPMDNNLEFLDYYDYQIKKDNLKRYLTLIKDAKKELTIPVIASINCLTAHEWGFFAKKAEDAGADALELNMFILPSNLSQTSKDNESMSVSYTHLTL